MRALFNEFLDLQKDQEQPHVIDQTIRGSVRLVGTNLWVLFFAILVASVGLNVNSTAVIIGAMLISPLMGPIIGVGYGTGINDFDLIKLSFKNFLIFTGISLLASSIYFALSPLDTPQSEILARTYPTLWDVLIAFFGGSAGIIALTRKSISNVVPGVAIATALMPPLCTAWFGIANGNLQYFGGAIFLYTINSVFIAFSTLIFVKLFKLPKLKVLDEVTQKRTTQIIGVTLLITILPSAYLAYKFVEQNRFSTAVEAVLTDAASDPDFLLLGQEVDPKKNRIVVTVGGDNPPVNLQETLTNQLSARGLGDTEVLVRRAGSNVDMSQITTRLQQDLYVNLQGQVDKLTSENQSLSSEVSLTVAEEAEQLEVIKELRALYPEAGEISLSRGRISKAEGLITASGEVAAEQPGDSGSAQSPSQATANGKQLADNAQIAATQGSDGASPGAASTSTRSLTQGSDTQISDASPSQSEDSASAVFTLVTITGLNLSTQERSRLIDWLTTRIDQPVRLITLRGGEI